MREEAGQYGMLDFDEGISVVTKFTGVDHRTDKIGGLDPLLWITTVTGGKHDGEKMLSATYSGAFDAHKAAVEKNLGIMDKYVSHVDEHADAIPYENADIVYEDVDLGAEHTDQGNVGDNEEDASDSSEEE